MDWVKYKQSEDEYQNRERLLYPTGYESLRIPTMKHKSMRFIVSPVVAELYKYISSTTIDVDYVSRPSVTLPSSMFVGPVVADIPRAPVAPTYVTPPTTVKAPHQPIKLV